MNATTATPRGDGPTALVRFAGACDCHVHVFDDGTRYPWDSARTYTPAAATLDELLALHARIGVDRMVIVQPSAYGADNRCTLDAVARLGKAGRAVAVIDESTSDEALRAMHAAGVRGVRVNLETTGQHDPEHARERLFWAAKRVAGLGWHVQTFTNLKTLAALADALTALPVTLVVDHFGRAQAEQGIAQPGFAMLCEAVASGRVYVKLSAPYRISRLADYTDAVELARALIAANPDRVLWGSDWPHPGTAAGMPKPLDEITPFRAEDDERAMARCLEWAATSAQARKLLVDNPARLYEF
ncbi:amidohydrolase family protein [Bordetella sp. LUAb4]|uniref:amidohydrolase family protein n=1 Tax=Bordetella sp. LUAb4 TaxID=2843195 RepID=UPI001E39445F|nr:amidohydrolase family protein [Bordetella sp. LUAb4]